MQQNKQLVLDGIKASEGGRYTDGVHPYDPGGPTKWGITIPDIPGATAETIKALTWEQAAAIYERRYWAGPGFAELPSGVDYTVADYGVNSGVSRAVKVLQRVVGVPEDGRIGPATMAAIAKRDAHAIIDAINDERMQFLRSLKIWPTYKNGWTARVKTVRATSHKLVSQPVTSAKISAVPKAIHPEPAAAKNAVKAGAPSAAVVSGGTWIDWVAAHPFETAAIVIAVGIAVTFAIKAINDWHKRRNETPMPGTKVVPAIS